MSKKSPMTLSLDYLNKQGMTCAIVEHWNAHAGVRQDCFGFGDILAYGREKGVLNIMLVQTTTAANFLARKAKILASPHFKGWTGAGGRVVVHGWGDSGLREEEL
jgi:hypothetical protein